MESPIFIPPWLINSVTKAFSSHTAVVLGGSPAFTIDTAANCPSITVNRTKTWQNIAGFSCEYCYNRIYLPTKNTHFMHT